MQLLISLLFIFHITNGQNSLVDEYVKNITELQNQILTWTNPKNSNSYLGKKFNPRKLYYDGEFDFIICGAGSAGSVIANRLSEISGWKILVLEAGTWENSLTDIPEMAGAFRNTNYNWGYHTTPQENGFKGFIEKQINIPRGKAVGGSSVINAMIYARGNKQDFNNWGKNNPGWTYDEVLPYFKKSEKVAFANADTNYHGTNGTLNVEHSRIVDKIGEAFLEGNKELGRKILDYNAESEIGVSIIQMNEINGRRDSGSKAFINPVKNRSNLHIFTNTLITKLLINSKHNEVYGVQYLKNGKLHYASASREVILSAGTINTPQILMLSGIGPRQHLKEMGIQVLKDLPVGDNMWDHIMYTFQGFKINYTYEYPDLKQQVNDYLNGHGFLTSPFQLQAIGFASVFDGTTEVPDVEFLLHSNKVFTETYKYFESLQKYTQETYNTAIKPFFGLSQWTLDIILLHPKSRGTVRLKSASPLEFPVINPNYFSDPRDAKTFVKALEESMKIANTNALQKYNSKLIKICHSACDCTKWGTDNFWKCMALNLSNSIYHLSGTTKMGPQSDNSSVVGNTLKVHGIKRLRVADCSVIPVSTSGHTNAVAYMIGEKASDLIKESNCDDILC